MEVRHKERSTEKALGPEEPRSVHHCSEQRKQKDCQRLGFDKAIKIDDGSNPVKYINEEFEILLYNHRIQRAKVDNSNIAKLDILNLKFDYY